MGRCWNDASRSSCSRGRVIGVGFGLFIFCVSIDRLSIVIDIYRLLVSRFTSTTRCRLIDFDSLSMFFITVVRFFRKTGNVVKSLKSDRQKQERVRGWNGTNCGVVPVLVRRCRFVSMPIRVLVQFLLFFIVVSFFLKRCSAFL